jgi:flavin reductase (DIM6/NTAB) family NADH-FMN oxidoreductase RutF
MIKKNDKRLLKPGNMLNPSPVVLVSCGETIDEYNIITIAWTGTVCSDPPLAVLAIRPERHSYAIIKRTGELVVNLCTEKLVAITDWCGVRSGKDKNKFIACDLTPVKGSKVKAPLIYEAPVNMECIVKQTIPLGTHELFMVEIVAVQVDKNLFDYKTDALRLDRANLLAYSHGEYYGLGKKLGKFGFSVKKKS